jgi:UTP--glucose-1-phosphate uridylyltransferase
MPSHSHQRRPHIAVIAAAGSASRMWPASKIIPKELFPLGKVPAIGHVVWEMIDAGIDDIRIIIRKGEPPAIAELLDPKRAAPPESVRHDPVVQRFEQMIASASFTFIEQEGPYGNGTPLLNGTAGLDEPCIFAFADDVVFGENPVAGLSALFERTGNPVLAVQEVTPEEVRKFGVLETDVTDGVHRVRRFVEKPGPGQTDSRLASLGRYLVTPELVQLLRSTPTGKGGELWLADAFIQYLDAGRTLNAYPLTTGQWHTVGTPEGYVRAAVAAMEFESLPPSAGRPA